MGGFHLEEAARLPSEATQIFQRACQSDSRHQLFQLEKGNSGNLSVRPTLAFRYCLHHLFGNCVVTSDFPVCSFAFNCAQSYLDSCVKCQFRVGPVSLLFECPSPSAVGFRASKIVVFSMKTCPRRSLAHVCQEIHKTFPTRVYSNTAFDITVSVRRVSIGASIPHGTPG